VRNTFFLLATSWFEIWISFQISCILCSIKASVMIYPRVWIEPVSLLDLKGQINLLKTCRGYIQSCQGNHFMCQFQFRQSKRWIRPITNMQQIYKVRKRKEKEFSLASQCHQSKRYNDRIGKWMMEKTFQSIVFYLPRNFGCCHKTSGRVFNLWMALSQIQRSFRNTWELMNPYLHIAQLWSDGNRSDAVKTNQSAQGVNTATYLIIH
jgi:hypothetical protein